MECNFKTCQKHSFRDLEFECGSYTIEDSRKIRARATTLSGLLDFVEVRPDITDKERMYHEDLQGMAKFKSPHKTAGLHECSTFNAQQLKPRKISDRDLHVFPLEMNLAVCLPQFYPTWKKGMISGSGRLGRKRSSSLNGWINDLMISDAALLNDKLSVYGDYGSPNGDLSQYDGIFKQLWHMSKATKKQIVALTLPALSGGDYVHICLGGAVSSFPFDTDQATTIQNILAWIHTGTNPYDVTNSLYTATSNMTDTIWVGARTQGQSVCLDAVQNTDSTFDWLSFFEGCTTGQLTVEVVQQEELGERPLVVDYVPLTKDNIEEHFCGVYITTLAYFDTIDGISADDVVFWIGPQLARTIRAYQTIRTAAFMGTAQVKELSIFGLNFQVHPQIKGDDYFATWRGNIQFGTDLLSDFSNVESDYDWDCQTIKFRLEAAAGIDFLYPSEVITNVSDCNPNHSYLDPAPKLAFQCAPPKSSPIQICGCEADFTFEVFSDDGDDITHLVITDASTNCSGGTYDYNITLNDEVGGSAEYTSSDASPTLEFAGATALDGLSITIELTLSVDGCSDSTAFKNDVVEAEDQDLTPLP